MVQRDPREVASDETEAAGGREEEAGTEGRGTKEERSVEDAVDILERGQLGFGRGKHRNVQGRTQET